MKETAVIIWKCLELSSLTHPKQDIRECVLTARRHTHIHTKRERERDEEREREKMRVIATERTREKMLLPSSTEVWR